MRNESRPHLSAFEQKIMRDYVPNEPSDFDILEAVFSLGCRMEQVKENLKPSYQKVIDLLRDELHGL